MFLSLLSVEDGPDDDFLGQGSQSSLAGLINFFYKN